MLIFIRTRCFIKMDICHSLQWPIRLGVMYSGWIWQVVVCQPLKSNCFDTLNDVTIAGTVNNWGRCPPRFQLSRKYLHKPNHEMCKFWTYMQNQRFDGFNVFVNDAFFKQRRNSIHAHCKNNAYRLLTTCGWFLRGL